MTLLSLLIAMGFERILLPSKNWQFSSWFSPYFNLLHGWHVTAALFQRVIGLIIVALLPAVAMSLLLQWAEGELFGLLSLALSAFTLLLAMGCLHARAQYKRFLRASCRGDEEACHLVAQELEAGCLGQQSSVETQSATGQEDKEEPVEVDSFQLLEEGVGQTLTWINYRYYIAVMLWLILFGVEGVVFYASLRALESMLQQKEKMEEEATAIRLLMRWIDFIPVRIASLGLTLVGNFSKAMPVWLENLLNGADSPKAHLVRVSLAAEEIENPENPTCVASVTQFVDMAKRNVVLMLCLIAVLTLYGSLG